MRSPDLTHQVAIGLICLGGYIALEWLSFIHEYNSVPTTPWNPGLGLVFALMVLGGPRYAAVLFAGVIVAEVTVLKTNLQWPVILCIATILASVYGTVAGIARKYLRLDMNLYHLRDVVILLAAGSVAALLVAVLLSMLMLLNGRLDWPDVTTAAVPLLIGDIIGIGVVTPLLLRIVLHGREMLAGSSLAVAVEGVVYAGLIGASLWFIVGADAGSGFKFFYLLFAPVMIAAVRHGIDGACVALAFTQLVLVAALHVFGSDARSFTEFQTLMLVLSATGLTVGAVVNERQDANRLVREAEARLREKEAEALQAGRFHLVSGMASALAHEINQPLTAVRALARSVQHILQTPKSDLSRAASNIATMIGQVDHAAGVVRHIREFIHRGRPHMTSVEIRSMLEDALTLVRAAAADRNVKITLEASGSLPSIHGDRVQLQQVVLNLVQNAMDAIEQNGQTNGRVHVGAYHVNLPPQIEIAVADNGPGIETDVAEKLFAPLRTSKSEGLGLGLSICRTIVEAHGGHVWLEARQPGETEFRFSLPLGTLEVR